jgi:hypothetical protein
MTTIAWAAYYGKRDVIKHFLTSALDEKDESTFDVDATFRVLDGRFKGKLAEEVADAMGHKDIAEQLKQYRLAQQEKYFQQELNENRHWLEENLKGAGIPDAYIDDYCQKLVREGFITPQAMQLMDAEALEPIMKKSGHRKLFLNYVETRLRNNSHVNNILGSICMLLFQPILLVIVCSAVLFIVNPTFRSALKAILVTMLGQANDDGGVVSKLKILLEQ